MTTRTLVNPLSIPHTRAPNYSHTRLCQPTHPQTVVDIDLRYPLMGGWKVDFTLGKSMCGCVCVCGAGGAPRPLRE